MIQMISGRDHDVLLIEFEAKDSDPPTPLSPALKAAFEKERERYRRALEESTKPLPWLEQQDQPKPEEPPPSPEVTDPQ